MSFSKSKYIRGLQCPKMIWMDKYSPALADRYESEGTITELAEVRRLAREYFGKYSLVEISDDKNLMAEKTRELIDSGARTICNATFIYEDSYTKIDILRVYPDGVELVAIRNAAGVHDIYHEDSSYDMYILSALGFKVKKVFNMVVNSSYTRQGELEIKKLFKLMDCTDVCTIKQKDVADTVSRLRADLEIEQGLDIDLSEGCFKPYPCTYWKHCSRALPTPNVFDITSLNVESKIDLYRKGIASFEQLSEAEVDLTDRQKLQVTCHLSDSGVRVDKNKVYKFLNTLTYPLYFLDFEASQNAIPPFDGTNAYMQIPFQYSLHVKRTRDGELEHYEFLGKEGCDNRQALANQLIKDIPYDVCVLAYGAAFEKSVIAKLAEQFPKLKKHLMNIHSNVVDLMQPFSNQAYYCRQMNGSHSIKNVLPALCPGDPNLDYHNLSGIHDGEEAKNAFAGLADKSQEEIARVRHSLLEYCKLDTLAMVKVLDKLYSI